jgi:hypothetical protein
LKKTHSGIISGVRQAVGGTGCNPEWREEVTKNHEPLKTLKAQRKARKAEGISGFLAFDFLCVLSVFVVIGFFMGFWRFPQS